MIIIDGGIRITIIEIKGNIIKIGIDAPPDVKVVREEIKKE